MQHDYNIANDSGANVRADLNNVLAAIKTMNSGATAPSATSAGMSWFDTSDANTWYWKLRNNSDDGWINVGALDVATDVFQPMIDDDLLTTYLTDNFYTETEMNSLLSAKADTSNTYTETEVNNLLSAKVSTTGNETIAGTKTFSSFPVTPSLAPSSDYQVANKKYVDDNSSTYGNSEVLSLFNASGSAPVYACRAYANFNQTGTQSINDSKNVSSLTDNGTGATRVNYITGLPETNPSAVAIGREGFCPGVTTSASSYADVSMRNYANSPQDSYIVSLIAI